MITSTSLTSDTFLAKIVAGCDVALNNAHMSQNGMGFADVLNSRNSLSVIAIYRAGHGMEFIDAQDNDVTEPVVAALREFHGYKIFQ